MIKRLLLTAVISGLLATNLLTLTNSAFNALLSGSLAAATGVRTVTGLMQGKIASQERALKKHASQQARHRAATRRFGNKVATRTRRVAAKSVAAIPAESIPVIGVGVLLADTGYELYAACENLRDVNRLYRELGMPDEVAADALHSACNPSLPDPETLWRNIIDTMGQWWDGLYLPDGRRG